MKRLYILTLITFNIMTLMAENGISTIGNGTLKLEINKKGAELFSIQDVESGVEYLWQGDPAHWRFRSPVLFPIVGAVYDNTYRVDGKEYNMAQHGLARHCDFEIVKCEEREIIFQLKSTAEMKESYPYDFVLEIGYAINGNEIVMTYRVMNTSDETIHFQIGAHPGFNYMNYNPEAEVQGYYSFNDMEQDGSLKVSYINRAGFLIETKRDILLDDRKIAITKDTFNDGALILESEQTKDISLLDASGKPYLRVSYDAPLVGLWSNADGAYAPFACIEPWYGRCDEDGYKGEFKDKEWMQSLAPKEEFESSITIEILR